MKFKGRNKRWKKKINKAIWKSKKKFMLFHGWVEIAENLLVPKESAYDYPTYIPTHLGGKVEKGRNIKLTEHSRDLPNRSVMREIKKQAKQMGVSARQYMFGEWPD